MRKVATQRWDGTGWVDDVTATFHQFGVSYEEFESGPGNYSTAIIELADGTVQCVLAERIKFLEPIQGV